MRLHKISVSFHGIDFTIVSQHTERLREPPLWEGIRRVTLVINRRARDETLVLKIRIKIINIFREEHPLVNYRLH